MRILAQKDRNFGSRVYLKPVYTINPNLDHERVGSIEIRRERFPDRGTVVVLYDFDDLRYIKTTELFSVDIEESTTYDPPTNSCKYQSLNGDLSTFEKLPLIIKKDRLHFNDTIQLRYSDHEFIFIENGDFILGPYSIKQRDNFDNGIEDDYNEDELENEDDTNVGSDYDENNYYDYNVIGLETDRLEIMNDFRNVIHKFYRNDIQKYIVENRMLNMDPEYCIHNIKELLKNAKPIEYILEETDLDIIKWAENKRPKTFTVQDREAFLSPADRENPIHRIRFERFVRIKEKSTSWVSFIDSYLKQEYFNSEEGNKRIENYIENHRKDIIKEKIKEIEDETQQKRKDQEFEIEKLIKEKESIIEDIEKLKVQKTHLLDENAQIRERNERLKVIEIAIEEKKKELEFYGSVKDAEDKRNASQREYNALLSLIAREEKKLSDYKSKNEEQAKEELRKLYGYVKAINEEYEPEREITSSTSTLSNIASDFTKPLITSKDFFDDAEKYLNERNRSFSKTEVINFLTCIQQNFVTIFVGLPGVGKTSLAHILSEFICSKQLKIEVPVGRGWNSRKNLLGFFNPLKSQYQSDEYGLIERIKAYNNSEELLKTIPCIVTLDEANLSPIEHYWSDFVSMSDNDHEKEIRLIKADGNEIYKLPEGFRFIFTVNHDHTTELLSPRLLDRACIIKLEHKSDSIKSFQKLSPLKVIQESGSFYSSESLNNIFNPIEDSLTFEEEKAFDEVLRVVTDASVRLGKQIPVSVRKFKAIRQYCSVTRDLYKEIGETQFLALDFAILQNIIPLINGQGDGFKERLNELKNILQNKSLIRSSVEVENIIAKGNEFNYYTYF